MKIRFLVFCFIFLFFTRCVHPESKSFERDNKGTNSSLIDKNDNKPLETNIENLNTVKMDVQNGVRYVWIEINGIRLRFIFDTGASSICISPSELNVLIRQGTVSEKDILKSESFTDATGTVSVGRKINLRTVKIGAKILQNVEALLVDNINAPLLLGQSALENFGSIEIDNENGVIIFR